MASSAGSYIEMRQRRYNFFPQSFQWQGRTFHVQQVERSWSKMGGWFSRRRARRLCSRVRTIALPAALPAGLSAAGAQAILQQTASRICQDLLANTWHVERVLA